MAEQAFFTLGEAATAAGKSKSTISRAISSGRLTSMSKEGGEYRIAASELFRVFPPERSATGQTEQYATHSGTGGTVVLQAKLEAAERLIEELRDERNDLRHRLDAESEERRRLSLILTDQRQPVAVAVPESPLQAPEKPVEGRLARAWSILRGKA